MAGTRAGGHAETAAGAVAWSMLRRGQTGVVREWRVEAEDAALLKAMGMCTGSSVTVVRTGEPCVVAINEGGVCACGGMCRIGLARGLAERVLIEVGSGKAEVGSEVENRGASEV